MHSLESDTVILPSVIAESVVSEAARYLNGKYTLGIPEKDVDRIITALETRANRLYATNEDWRAHVKRNNTYGRDYLYTFMRHWLAGELKDSHPKLFRLLPASFSNGEPVAR